MTQKKRTDNLTLSLFDQDTVYSKETKPQAADLSSSIENEVEDVMLVDEGINLNPVLKVSEFFDQVNQAIMMQFTGEVWVIGEIRSLSTSQNGHVYLDLIDTMEATNPYPTTLKAVIWSSNWVQIKREFKRYGLELEKGMIVKVKGEARLWKSGISVQINISSIDVEALIGNLAIEREKLLKKLRESDLLDKNKRLKLDLVPLRLGLIASKGTQGYLDFLGQIEMSEFNFELLYFSTPVQGSEAPKKIASAIDEASSCGLNLIVVIRGGGSKGDLSAFDSEEVAFAIANSSTPVWCGIGHTEDISVADLVSNRYFSTPTAVGKEIVALIKKFVDSIDRSISRIRELSEKQIVFEANGLSSSRERLVRIMEFEIEREEHDVFTKAKAIISQFKLTLSSQSSSLNQDRQLLGKIVGEKIQSETLNTRHVKELLALKANSFLNEKYRDINFYKLSLSAFDPIRQMKRGYAIVRSEGGKTVRSIEDIVNGQTLTTQIGNGTFLSEVLAIKSEIHNGID